MFERPGVARSGRWSLLALAFTLVLGSGLLACSSDNGPGPVVVVAGGCSSDPDACLTGTVCVGGDCVSAASTCQSDDDCEAGQNCFAGNCVNPGGCDTDADCDADQVCHNGACVAK
jgi:hypothetical protein